MNHVLSQAGVIIEHTWLLGVTTLVFIACFVGWSWWAYSSRNRERMDEAARMPLLEDDA